MKSLKGFGLDDILKEIGGANVDVGQTENQKPDPEEELVNEWGDEVPEDKEMKKAGVHKKVVVRTKKTLQKEKSDRQDYTTTWVKKEFVKLVRMAYPDLYIQAGIEIILSNWALKNRDKIYETYLKKLKDEK